MPRIGQWVGTGRSKSDFQKIEFHPLFSEPSVSHHKVEFSVGGWPYISGLLGAYARAVLRENSLSAVVALPSLPLP